MHSKFDVIIIGGGLGGCFAAIQAAALGLNTAIVDRRAYLGGSFAEYNRLWIKKEGLDQISGEAEDSIIKGILESAGWEYGDIPASYDDELPLFSGSVKKLLLKSLLDNNVKVLLMSHPAGLAVEEGKAGGLLLANKYGVQWVEAGTIVDATENTYLQAISEPGSINGKREVKIHYVLEFEGNGIPAEREFKVPEFLLLDNNRFSLHAGKRCKGNLLLEFSYRTIVDTGSPYYRSLLESESRLRAETLLKWIRNNKLLNGARVIELASESFVIDPARSDEQNPITYAADNVYRLKPLIKWELSFKDILQVKQRSSDIIKSISHNEGLIQVPEYFAGSGWKIPVSECRISSVSDESINFKYVKINEDRLAIQKSRHDIAIAGAGTGGMMAAFGALENHNDVLVVEGLNDFGGTRTLGYVSGYYFGYKGAYTEKLDEKIEQLAKEIAGTPRVARMLYYHKIMREKNVKYLLNTHVCSARVINNKVAGFLAVNESGLHPVRTKIVVDATGDGDVAYFAGVDFEYGDPRDGNLQSYSQWGIEPVNVTGGFRNFHYLKDFDVVSLKSYQELLRGIYLAQLNNSPYKHANFITVRESRRIKGKYRLNMTDIYEEKLFDDCIGVAYTTVDSHGRISSWYARLGYMPCVSPIRVRIPYRCCVPENLEGILIASKAISATRDAGCMCRMNSDIQNMGYALGMAAAKIVQNNRPLDYRDIKEIQKRLNELGVLPDWAFCKEKVDDSPETRLMNLKKGDADSFFDFIRLPQNIALPLLENEYSRTSGAEREIIAMALAWYGSDTGMDIIAGKLAYELQNEKIDICADLNTEFMTVRHGFHPEQGINAYWRINQLIALIGISGRKNDNAISALYEATAKAQTGGPPVTPTKRVYQNRVDHRLIPFYDRIINLCFAWERIADRRGIPVLENLLNNEYIGGNVTYQGCGEVKNYFSAYLEMNVARALARCGGKSGLLRLVDYLGDVHLGLRQHAYEELRDICGIDFGMSMEKWKNYLDKSDEFPPRPYNRLWHVD